MDISLVVAPEIAPMDWDTFVSEAPAHSIALDGYVSGPPRVDLAGPYANFNHHEGVSRLETRSTCAQVLMALRQGLYLSFRENGLERAVLHVNDCDEDVCLAVFLLSNPHLASHAMNPLLNRLVAMEDALDATAGAYPFPSELPSLEGLAWIFDPYRRFRASGEIDRKGAAAHRAVIEDVGYRIQAHIVGNGGTLPLDTRHDVLRQGTGWSLVDEIGPQARTGMFADGIRAFVSGRERPDGAWTYSIGRMSPFVPFDIPVILDALNVTEGTPDDPWGGSDTIGGSPRVAGSRLSPDEVYEIVERVQSAHSGSG